MMRDPANPSTERCYRCRKPFPTRRVIETHGERAVIKYEPVIYTAHVWGIPNTPLAVPLCPGCGIVHVAVAEVRAWAAEARQGGAA